MKNVGQPTKKADFQVKKGLQAYSRLSIVTGLVILGAIPLAIWSYTQHPEWLGQLSQSINGEDDVKNSPNNISESANSAQTKNDNQKKQTKSEPVNLAKKESQKPAQQDSSSTLATQIFSQLPDQTINLGKDEKSKNPNPTPKTSQLTNLFPALPKTFISPFEARKDNNSYSNQQTITRRPAVAPLVNPSAENPLNSSLRRFNTNQRAITSTNNSTYTPSNSNYPNYSNTYPGQTYNPNPYQAQPNGNAQAQQPYTSNPYQVQPYGNVQAQQPYNPNQVQPYGTGVQQNPYR